MDNMNNVNMFHLYEVGDVTLIAVFNSLGSCEQQALDYFNMSFPPQYDEDGAVDLPEPLNFAVRVNEIYLFHIVASRGGTETFVIDNGYRFINRKRRESI